MWVKVCEFIRQIVSVWNNIKGFLSKFFLQFHDVYAKSILSRKLKTVGKMVYLLILVEIVINVLLVRLTGPQNIPVMSLSLLESIVFQNGPKKFGLTFDKLKVHVYRTFVHIHIRVENSSFLEIYRALPIMNKLKKEILQLVTREKLNGNKSTYNWWVFQWFEIYEFGLEVVLDILELCLGTLECIVLHVRYGILGTLILPVILSIFIKGCLITWSLHKLYLNFFFFPVPKFEH